jgi:hypothetical protein
VQLRRRLLPLPELSRPIALYHFLSGLACLLLIGCLFRHGRGRSCLRRFCCWLVLSRLILSAAARLCKAVLALLSLAGPLLSPPSLMLVKRARLLLLLKRARFPLGLAGWVGWLCWLAGSAGFLWVQPGEC